jgi:hypothetical protein
MGMALSEVFDHLSDLAELQNGLDIPTHGGDEDLLEEVTLNERFDHSVYYALQTLYGKLIYRRSRPSASGLDPEGEGCKLG